ncbi:hypothetical protein QFZ75_004019 [Streptomyces sp. V3I8]|uniref:hypothetical protein n=1 Tax=Streptomyces sp. V3I8 TaxID=3042279 RepID=UPI00277E2A6E|nr:hypothetical protein [Streptomyces sp. V3I8]MDQ1037603.1 hypothetical protein [Streptomyces sp. V3I8]
MLNRPPRRARRTAAVLVPVLAVAALLSTAGCSDGRGGAADDTAGSASPVAARAASPSPSVTVAPTLTEAQAKSALVTPADLGDGWTRTEGAATWRDALLKGKADVPDCQRLLDGLYAEDLLGEPAGARAVTGLDDAEDQAQVRYQIGAYDRAALDASLAWLRTVPDTCGQFTATDVRGGRFTVQAAAAPLPGLGEAREGLRVTVSGDGGGLPAVLTLDFAAVRVGDSALSLTNGGLDEIDADDTREAAEAGTRRLRDVLAGRTPAARPSEAAGTAESPAPSGASEADGSDGTDGSDEASDELAPQDEQEAGAGTETETETDTETGTGTDW